MKGSERLFKAVIYFMLFANVFDMGGDFGIKYLSYLVGIAYLVYNYSSMRLRIEEVSIAFVLFVLTPAWALFKGMSSGGSLGEASSQITPFLPGVLLLFLLARGGYDYAIQQFFKLLTALACTAIVIFCLWAIIPFSGISQFLLSVFQDSGHGHFGARGIAGIRIPYVYFKATLFFVAGFTYFLFRGQPLRAVLFFITLILTFSKAGILLCLLFLMAYIILEAKASTKWAAIAFTCLAAYGLSTWNDAKLVSGYIDTITSAVQGKALTTQIRIGHWNSFVDLITDRPDYLIYGQGVGTSYYSDGRRRHVYNTELDHVDAVRQFGFLWFIGFSLIAGYIALRFIRTRNTENRALGMSFVSIYLAAGTNPVLITPLFMMLMAVLYTKVKYTQPLFDSNGLAVAHTSAHLRDETS